MTILHIFFGLTDNLDSRILKDADLSSALLTISLNLENPFKGVES